jgi:hypothetical protein
MPKNSTTALESIFLTVIPSCDVISKNLKVSRGLKLEIVFKMFGDSCSGSEEPDLEASTVLPEMQSRRFVSHSFFV